MLFWSHDPPFYDGGSLKVKAEASKLLVEENEIHYSLLPASIPKFFTHLQRHDIRLIPSSAESHLTNYLLVRCR